jgi:hypothetical protein
MLIQGTPKHPCMCMCKNSLNGPAKQPNTLGKWMKSSSLLRVATVNLLDFSKLATPPNCPLRLSLGSFFKEKLVIGLSHVWRAHMVYVHWVQHPVN